MRSQTEPLDFTSLNKSSYRPISLFTATQPRAPSDRRALSPSTCQCDTTSVNEARSDLTSDHDGPDRQTVLDPAEHALSTEPGTSEATYFAPVTGETLANQIKFVEAVLHRSYDDAQDSPRDRTRQPTQDVRRAKRALEPSPSEEGGSQTQRPRRPKQEASQEAEEKRRILAAEQTHRFVTDYISKIPESAQRGKMLSAPELDATEEFLAGLEDPLLEIAPTTTVTVMRSYATTRVPRIHKAREKAKQLLIQSERAAQDRTLLVRMRAGLQQKIAEEQARHARASATLGHNQLIPPTRCSYETRE